VLTFLKNWLEAHRPKKLNQLLSVEYDEREIRVRALEGFSPKWNQTFEWSNIRRVCFKDGGIFGSDIIYISVKSPDIVHTVLTEARGGSDFFGALCDKGYFPEEVWRRAIAESSGGMHCWPKE
jgi:hypothetical protein